MCQQFDVIESDLKTVVNDIKNPVPNPFFSSIWGSHISQLEADIKATNYDVNIGYYSRDKEMDKLFRFM